MTNALFFIQRVRQHPNEYACIGCNLPVTEHEVIYESEYARISRGAAVGDAYRPLYDMPDIRQQLLDRNESLIYDSQTQRNVIEDG